jgi:hypothetical protein
VVVAENYPPKAHHHTGGEEMQRSLLTKMPTRNMARILPYSNSTPRKILYCAI